MARLITLSEPMMLDAVIWREVTPAAADQRRLYAEALRLNPHIVGLSATLPAGTEILLPERPASRPSGAVEMIRIFG